MNGLLLVETIITKSCLIMLLEAVFVELGVHVEPRTQALNRGKLITYQRYIQRLRPVYMYPDSFISADISLRLQNSTRLHGV